MTSNWHRELRHSWPLLSPADTAQIATLPLDISFPAGRVRAGVDGSGFRHLLIPIGMDESKPTPDEMDGTLLVRVATHSFANRSARYVDVGCFRSDLNDLFDDVLADILDAISNGPSEPPGVVAASVVDRWRNLLEVRRQRLLTLVAQMSLFGELGVLELLTDGVTIDVEVWRGPLRERHDLLLPVCAVEVKAIGPTSKFIEIHGVQQLEPPVGRPLFLVIATIEEQEAGESLPELIDRIRGRVDDRLSFDRRLAAAGFSSLDRDRFEHRFGITDVAHLMVDDSTPRIVPASFGSGGPAAGVDHLVYTVSLDVLDPLLSRDLHALQAQIAGGIS